jgi:hypothetical protein
LAEDAIHSSSKHGGGQGRLKVSPVPGLGMEIDEAYLKANAAPG